MGTMRYDGAVQRFREETEKYLKQVPPEKYLPFAARLLDRTIGSSGAMSYFPPHWILHSMEASCAYRRGHRTADVTDPWLRRLFNTYNAFGDPVLKHWLTAPAFGLKGVDLLAASMTRQQLPAQRKWARFDFARAELLLLRGRMPTLRSLCEGKLGFTFEEWITVCLVTWAGSSRRNAVTVPRSYIGAGAWTAAERIDAVLSRLAFTIDEIGSEHRRLRQRYPARLEGQLPSLLRTRPLIWLGPEVLLVAHQNYLLEAAPTGLLRILRESFPDAFSREAGKAFEEYVGALLAQVPGGRLVGERDLAERTSGDVCDWLLSTPTEILLVEAKAVEYTKDIVSENAFPNDTAVRKVAKGLKQLANVAEQLSNGKYEAIIGPLAGRPILGTVVTYDEIPGIGTDLGWDSIGPGRSSLEPFAWRPQAMGVASLEVFLGGVRASGESVAEVFHSKLSEDFRVVGEWPTWLRRHTGGRVSLPFMEQGFGELWERVIGRLRPP